MIPGIYEKNAQRYLLETTAKRKASMIFPVDRIRQRFCPIAAVDSKFHVFQYEGARLYLENSWRGNAPAAGAATAHCRKLG